MHELLKFEDRSQQELPTRITDKIIYEDDDWYYADREHVTNSMLSELKKSPLHLKAYLDKANQKEEKNHNVYGRAFHCAILEPNFFNERFFVLDDEKVCLEIGGAKPRGTKKYKEWKANKLEKSKGKAILGLDDYNDIMRMRDKIHGIDYFRNLIEITHKEQIMHDEIHGIKRKVKLDAVRHEDFALDLKSSKDPVGKFRNSFYKYDYGRQMSWYKDTSLVKSIFVLSVEKTWPYSIGFFEVSDDTLDRGREEYESLLENYNVNFLNRGIKNFDTHYTRQFI